MGDAETLAVDPEAAILGIDDAAADSAPSSQAPSETSEPTSPSESSGEATQAAETPAPKSETLDKGLVEKSKPVEDNTLEAYQAVVPSVKELRERVGESEDLRFMDKALAGGNPQDLAELIVRAQEQAGARFPEVVDMAVRFLEHNALQEFSRLRDSLVREVFREEKFEEL